MGDQTLPIENDSGASLLQLQYVAEYCHEEEKKDDTRGQHSSSLVLK